MKRYGMAVIGLGVVGRRMLEQAAASRGLQVVAAWDSSAAARTAAAAGFPGLPLSDSAAAAIRRLDVDVVYVAVPPLAHAGLVRDAIAAGKAVFCEKPLGVDVAQSAALTEEMARSGLPHAVNFVFASSAAVDALRDAIAAPSFGLRAVEIRTRFHEWPRAWQAGAAWLQRADQGGFTREVLSHYVYLLQRVLGGAELAGAAVTGPAGDPGAAETALSATLRSGGVPVTVAASVGGTAPDLIEARFIGAAAEWRLSDWYRLETFDAKAPQGRPAPGLPADPRLASYQRQLDQLHAMLSGDTHSLPDFADALAVQRTVEAMLTTRGRDE
jgi:predicted dehydrogenase